METILGDGLSRLFLKPTFWGQKGHSKAKKGPFLEVIYDHY